MLCLIYVFINKKIIPKIGEISYEEMLDVFDFKEGYTVYCYPNAPSEHKGAHDI